MKSTESREIVCTILLNKFRINNPDIMSAIAEDLSRERKLSRLQFRKIWNETIELKELEDIMLCVLYSAISKYYKINDVNLYFTDVEITESKNIVVNDGDLKYPLVLENAIRLSDDRFLIPMGTKFISKLDNSNLLIRERNAQRETIVKNYNGMTVEYIKIFPKAIEEIKQKLLSGEYYPDEMKFNLNDNGEASYKYDEENRTLTILSGDISITDGNNRTIGIVEAQDEDPELDTIFPITFTIYPLWKAQAQINQQEKKNAIIQTVVSSYENTSENDIVNNIIIDRNLSKYLKGKILKTKQNVNTAGVFLFSDLSMAIKNAYDDSEINRYKKKTTEWVVEFLAEVSYILEDIFKDPRCSRKNTWALDTVAVYVYMYLSKQLKEKTDWQKELESILQNIDFSKENSPLGKIAQKENLAAKKFVESLVIKSG